MIIGRDLVDYYEDERLYSTGDDYLDDLLEKAFCDGYEYAQYEFSDDDQNDDQNKDDKKKKGVGKKILKGVGIAAGTTALAAGAYYGGRAIQRKHIDNLINKSSGGTDEYRNLVKKQQRLKQGNALDRFGRKVAGKVKNVFTSKHPKAYAAEPDAY